MILLYFFRKGSDGMTQIFCNVEMFERIKWKYAHLEDCGESTIYPGNHWYQDEYANVAIYVKMEVMEDAL